LAYWNTVHKTAWRLSKENLFSFPTPTVTLDENSYGIAGLTDEEFIRGCLRAVAPTEELKLNRLIRNSRKHAYEYNWRNYLDNAFAWDVVQSEQLPLWIDLNAAIARLINWGECTVKETETKDTDVRTKPYDFKGVFLCATTKDGHKYWRDLEYAIRKLHVDKYAQAPTQLQESITDLTSGMNKVIDAFAGITKREEEKLRVEKISKNQKNVYSRLHLTDQALEDFILAYGYNSDQMLQVFPSKADAKLYFLRYIQPKLFPDSPHKALQVEYAELAKVSTTPWKYFETFYKGCWVTLTAEPTWTIKTFYRKKETVVEVKPPLHPHGKITQEYAEVAKTNPRPWEEFEVQDVVTREWKVATTRPPFQNASISIRRKVAGCGTRTQTASWAEAWAEAKACQSKHSKTVHPHAKIAQEYWKLAETEAEPWRGMEYYNTKYNKWVALVKKPTFFPEDVYRWKVGAN